MNEHSTTNLIPTCTVFTTAKIFVQMAKKSFHSNLENVDLRRAKV